MVATANGLELFQLRTLDALYQERSVTQAAQRLHLTPSAISHSLRKLRGLLDDELFRREARGMEPTERVHAMMPAIREALAILDYALGLDRFNPATSQRHFRIACFLSLRLELAPFLARVVQESTQAVSLDLRQIDEAFEGDLEAERIDLALVTVDHVRPGLSSLLLRHERVVFAQRADHPRGSGPLSIEELAHWPHVDVRANDFFRATARERTVKETLEHTEVARILSARGLQAQIGMIVPDTLSALEVIKRTDMLALCPRRVAERHAGDAVRLLDPPYQSVGTPMRLIWSMRRDKDDGLRWLRQLIVQSVGERLPDADLNR